MLDRDWIVRVNLKIIDLLIPAILLKKDSIQGAVRVNTSPILNKVLGPIVSASISIVIIKLGEIYRIY